MWRPLWRTKTTIAFVCVSRLTGSIILAGPFITSTLYKKNGTHFRPVSGRGKNHKPTNPQSPMQVLVSHPSPNPKRTQIGTRARKVKRTRNGTRARNSNEIELELEHDSQQSWIGTRTSVRNEGESDLEHENETIFNWNLKTNRTWIGTRASIRMLLKSHKIDLNGNKIKVLTSAPLYM